VSRSQRLKGTTERLILGALEHESLHGYDILQRIRDAGSGLVVSEGALYPALHRLEKRGAVTGAWEAGSGGPRRRYYALTEPGRGQLAESRREWERFVAAVEAVTSLPSAAEGRNG
jgi:DNA-binding PadR family transcriptional regulator